MAQVEAGRNIALKVPAFRHADTVAFYRDRVGLPVLQEREDTVLFAFGSVRLWVDRIEHQSQMDVWLELVTDDVEGATVALAAPVRQGLEPLGNVDGRWISDPAGTVLLLRNRDDQ